MATYPNPLTTRYMDKAVKERPTTQALRQQYIGLGLATDMRGKDAVKRGGLGAGDVDLCSAASHLVAGEVR